MSVIHTEHLDLIPLSPVQLKMYMEQSSRLEAELHIPLSRSILTPRVLRAIGMKLAKMENTEEMKLLWITYWLIVIRKIPFGAGMAGFKGYPDQNGEVEIGYGIDPGYQNRGYMTEAVTGMIKWAFGEKACRSIVAIDVDKSNIASQRVLEKVGMAVFEKSEEVISFRIRRDASEKE